MWSWYTGAGLTVVERIDRVDHKLQQAVPELGVALPCRVRGRAPAGLIAPLSGPGTAAAGAAAAATPAAASGLPGCRYAAASARTRHAAHARLATVGRVRMLLKHTHNAISALSGNCQPLSRRCCSPRFYGVILLCGRLGDGWGKKWQNGNDVKLFVLFLRGAFMQKWRSIFSTREIRKINVLHALPARKHKG